jgi:dTDP-4-amino-4,6-dideoxygalactose transaminase
VWSPLPASALLAGAAGLAGTDRRAAVAARLRERLGATDLLLTDSGTAALGLAIRAAGGDARPAPVALPAYCCYDVATAADWAGGPVLLYDLDPATLGPDWDSLRRAVRAGAGSVVIAHLFGLPVDLHEALRLAGPTGTLVIEDAAQSAGGAFEQRPLGAWGDVGVLSFGRGKGTTGGGGGALAANREAGARLVERARPLVAPGLTGAADLVRLAAQWLLARPAIYGLPSALPFLGLGQTVYRAPHAPRGAARLQGAVLERTLPLEPGEAEVRRVHATRLIGAATRSGQWHGPRVPDGAAPSWLRLPVLPAGAARPATVGRARRLGIMPGYPRALADLRGFGGRVGNADWGFPGARTLAERLITLPTHSRLRERDLEALETWLAHPS